MKFFIVIICTLLVLDGSCFVVRQKSVDEANNSNLTKMKRGCACERFGCLCDLRNTDKFDLSVVEPNERSKRKSNHQESPISDQTAKVRRFKRGGCFCNSYGCACDLPNNSRNNYVRASHSSSGSSSSSSSHSSSSSVTYYG